MPHTDLHDPDHPRAGGVWSASASEALINDDDTHRPPRGATTAAAPPATARGLWGPREQRSMALVDEPVK